jgi:signal transduction histidine kinase
VERILIVEDSPTQSAELSFILEAEGFAVEAAPDGARALDRLALAEQSFDLVLSDIVMPGMSGYELCRAIKSDARLRALPVILLTSLSDVTDILQGLEHGADNYVTKPFDAVYLAGRIRQTLAEKARIASAGAGAEADVAVFRGQRFAVTSDKSQILGFLLSAFEDFVRAKAREQESRLAAERQRMAAEAARLREERILAEKAREEELARTLAQKVEERTAELVLANEELRRKAEELARSNAELEQFARVASHDLQEPLRTIRSYARLLRRRYQSALGKDGEEFLAFIDGGASRMEGLIKGVLELARVGSGVPARAPFEAEAALAQALENLQAAIRESDAAVTHGPLPIVVGDKKQVAQLFQNLVGNALKYRGAEAPAVRVEAARTKEGWLFSVRDNGIGIEPRYADRVFLLFQRLHTQQEIPGTGIGLALCKKIVEQHGGRIWVESAPGAGATFFFTLPG